MDWLAAALAFAITMLGLSIVVSATVETVHRIVGLREKGLRLMLGHFYDAVIAPHVARLDPAIGAGRDPFLDAMTVNRAPTGEFPTRPGRSGSAGAALFGHAAGITATQFLANERHFLSWIWGGRRLGSLSLDDFMGRLGSSVYGDALAKIERDVGTSGLETVLHDLARKFDDFGLDASVYFQARARLLSVLIAFVIAWQLHVHPYVLFSTFLHSPAIAQKVADLGPKFVKESEDAQKRLEAVGKNVDQKGEANIAEVQADLKTLQATTKDAISSLSGAGVPIGWTTQSLEEARFARSFMVLVYPRDASAAALSTVGWLLFGGLLIGLGGPFWRDLVLSMTNLRGGTAKPEPKAQGSGASAAGTGPAVAAVNRFLIATGARAIVTGGPQANLETDGAVG
jgi:hypothetical protein